MNRRVYRTVEGPIIGSFFCIAALATLIAIIYANSSPTKAFDLVVLVAFTLLAIRGFRVGVVQTSAQVTVRTLQWTYRFDRSRIRRFESEEHSYGWFRRLARTQLVIEFAGTERRRFNSFGATRDAAKPDKIALIAHDLNQAWALSDRASV